MTIKELAELLEKQGIKHMSLEEAAKLLPVLPEWEEFQKPKRKKKR